MIPIMEDTVKVLRSINTVLVILTLISLANLAINLWNHGKKYQESRQEIEGCKTSAD